ERGAVPAIPGISHGCVAQGGARSLCRGVVPQRRFQESVGRNAGVPQRRLSVVAGRRIQLRRLSHPQSHENLKQSYRLSARVRRTSLTGQLICALMTRTRDPSVRLTSACEHTLCSTFTMSISVAGSHPKVWLVSHLHKCHSDPSAKITECLPSYPFVFMGASPRRTILP